MTFDNDGDGDVLIVRIVRGIDLRHDTGQRLDAVHRLTGLQFVRFLQDLELADDFIFEFDLGFETAAGNDTL